jgi:hypothetical protein
MDAPALLALAILFTPHDFPVCSYLDLWEAWREEFPDGCLPSVRRPFFVLLPRFPTPFLNPPERHRISQLSSCPALPHPFGNARWRSFLTGKSFARCVTTPWCPREAIRARRPRCASYWTRYGWAPLPLVSMVVCFSRGAAQT